MEANHEASQSADKAATSTAQYENLKELSEDVLAEIKDSYRTGGKASEAMLERLARCTDRWKVHRQGLHAARIKAYEEKIKAKNAERAWMTIQSGMSYLRESIKREVVD